jgi:hypothetical protein
MALCGAALAAALAGCDEEAVKPAPAPAPKTGTVRIQREVYPSILLQVADAELHAPMQAVADANAAGGKCAIAPEGPNHQELNKGGDAAFKFEVVESGEYFLWVRAHWCCSCGNSLGISLDGVEQKSGIEDGIFQTWHWVRLKQPLARLTAGAHQLVIKSREDGSGFDQVLLTLDADYRPSGIEQPNVAKRTTPPARPAPAGPPAATTTTLPAK